MIEQSDDVEFDWEFDEIERSVLAFELQELVVRAGKIRGEKPTFREVHETAMDEFDITYVDLGHMLEETFGGSYNSLMRSLGEYPARGRVPQDRTAALYSEEVDLPVTNEKASKQNLPSVLTSSSKYMGSHSGLMDVLGYFNEYMDLWRNSSKNENYDWAVQMRARDHKSLIEAVESSSGKNYEEMSFKYSTD